MNILMEKEGCLMDYKKLLLEKDQEIDRLNAYCNELRKIQHGIITRLQALELHVARIAIKASDKSNPLYDIEFNNELIETQKDITDLSSDVDKKSSKLRRYLIPPKTKVTMLDNLIDYFSAQCIGKDISFRVNVLGNMLTMVKKIISSEHLQELISIHTKNAMDSLEDSYNPFKSILMAIGLLGEHYALTILDDGKPFDPDTLVRLGTERATTRANYGGSGFGFMSTFEIINEYKASLIITEMKPGSGGFAKSITIRFDNKKQYIIETYRSNDFIKSDRYIIVDK
jgi:signal transduction histidine kinase